MKRKMKKNRIKAIIFDLDGVLTQTQHVHFKAWKTAFDQFLQTVDDENADRRPMTEEDYVLLVDGKPRYEGVKSFLESRKTSLPYGNPQDSPEKKTVCGLGNKKNELFNEYINRGGVKKYNPAIEKLRKWYTQGFKTAIVSSSKNCLQIIKQVGIADLFDTRVDGKIAAERKLKGKPNPDIFIEAAKEIAVAPEEAVVFEDAISGVQAGQKGHFGLVVGVNRSDNEEALLNEGADIIINSFDEIDFDNNPEVDEYFNLPKPLVFSEETKIFELLENRDLAFFLDYDGTLTPIVKRPEDARLSEEMRETLKQLSKLYPVAIITGRDTQDVKDFIQLDNLIYAGSHGYSINGPDGLFMEHEKAGEIIPLLDRIEKELQEELRDKTKGVQIERKRYAIALHYRNARETDVPVVYEHVAKMLKKHKGIKKGEGKKVVEIKPDLDWHKGKALLWLLDALDLKERDKCLPVFIGDDITDEDAFRAVKEIGIGILVGTHGQDTAAQYSLKNVFQVREFFETIIAKNKKRS